MGFLNNISIGCIGTGNMGSAIIAGLSKHVEKSSIFCFDIDKEKLNSIVKKYKIQPANGLSELVAKSKVILLSVKPDIIPSVLNEIKDNCGDKILVSIAAGIKIESIANILKTPHKIVRVMPNTPALVGEGMAVISPNENVDEDSLKIVSDIFSLTGRTLIIPEKLMDAVTGLSGCGPAYVFTLIQAMSDGGVKMGIPRKESIILAAQTVSGAARMVLETGEDPMALRGKVTSPGGSTIDGVHILEKAGFSGIIMDAIEAAAIKSARLGEKK